MSSGLVCAALAALVFAMLPEEYPILQAVDTMEAAGFAGVHRWGFILPNSSRVSPLTYQSLVAVRYPELVSRIKSKVQIGHFGPHSGTAECGGFRAIFWDVPRDRRRAIDDLLVFFSYLKAATELPLNSSCSATAMQYMICCSSMGLRLPGMGE